MNIFIGGTIYNSRNLQGLLNNSTKSVYLRIYNSRNLQGLLNVITSPVNGSQSTIVEIYKDY